jgi:hypothetical protein
MGGRSWTDADDKFLRDNYETMTNKEMGDQLGRTADSVQLRVNRMGLKGVNDRKPRRMGTWAATKEIVAGDVFHFLTVDEVFAKETEEGRRTYCRCTCRCEQKDVEREASALRARENHSCGCEKTRKTVERLTTHGMSKTDIYKHWCHMRDRCLNTEHKEYHNYGGRGIVICDEWDDAGLFCEWAASNGYAAGLTLDRIDTNGAYTPQNCRWSTPKEQANNRRTNRLLAAFGETKNVAQWSQDARCRVNLNTLRTRLRDGWGIEEALTTPAFRRPT